MVGSSGCQQADAMRKECGQFAKCRAANPARKPTVGAPTATLQMAAIVSNIEHAYSALEPAADLAQGQSTALVFLEPHSVQSQAQERAKSRVTLDINHLQSPP
jgi:hypothetical protein